MAIAKKVHRAHPSGGTVCDHKDADDSLTIRTKKDEEVTCLKCKGILDGTFGGRPFTLSECK